MRNTLIIALLIVVSGCVRPVAPLMSWSEYAGLDPQWPYVLQLQLKSGALLYFGSAHSYDPTDPQLARLEAAWSEFAPQIAFTEGASRTYRTRDEAIRNGGEPALVRFLASRDDVPVASLEPSRAEEVVALQPRFSREQLKLFYILRDTSQVAERSGASAVRQEVERLLAYYAEVPGLSGSPRTFGEFEASYARLMPGSTPYDAVPRVWFDPVERLTFLNDISRASGAFRDEHVVAKLAAHVRAGHRVFAVMGGSHVVIQERALRSMLR